MRVQGGVEVHQLWFIWFPIRVHVCVCFSGLAEGFNGDGNFVDKGGRRCVVILAIVFAQWDDGLEVNCSNLLLYLLC